MGKENTSESWQHLQNLAVGGWRRELWTLESSVTLCGPLAEIHPHVVAWEWQEIWKQCWIGWRGATFVASSVYCVKGCPISWFDHLYLLCDRWAGWRRYWLSASATSAVDHWCHSNGTGPTQTCRDLKEQHSCRCNVESTRSAKELHPLRSLHRYTLTTKLTWRQDSQHAVPQSMKKIYCRMLCPRPKPG